MLSQAEFEELITDPVGFNSMTIASCQTIANTIGQLYTCAEVNGFVRIRTPYLYPDGDAIDLYLKPETQTLTDFGETLRWLDAQAVGPSLSKKQEFFLQDIQITYGVELFNGMLVIRVENDLSEAITRLSQAALSVSNLAKTTQQAPTEEMEFGDFQR